MTTTAVCITHGHQPLASPPSALAPCPLTKRECTRRGLSALSLKMMDLPSLWGYFTTLMSTCMVTARLCSPAKTVVSPRSMAMMRRVIYTTPGYKRAVGRLRRLPGCANDATARVSLLPSAEEAAAGRSAFTVDMIAMAFYWYATIAILHTLRVTQSRDRNCLGNSSLGNTHPTITLRVAAGDLTTELPRRLRASGRNFATLCGGTRAPAPGVAPALVAIVPIVVTTCGVVNVLIVHVDRLPRSASPATFNTLEDGRCATIATYGKRNGQR